MPNIYTGGWIGSLWAVHRVRVPRHGHGDSINKKVHVYSHVNFLFVPPCGAKSVTDLIIVITLLLRINLFILAVYFVIMRCATRL